MSKADEMFKKLGYKKREAEYCIYYENKDNKTVIEFGKLVKSIGNYQYSYEDNRYLVDIYYFSMQELQAINEKCKEMGWIEL